MRSFTTLVVVVALAIAPSLAAAQQAVPPAAESAAFKQLAAGIPLGTRVKVRTSEGRRLTATVMALEDERIILKRLSRTPEPAIALRFDELTELRRDDGKGFSVAKAIAIGVAAGVGAILTLFAIAVTIDD